MRDEEWGKNIEGNMRIICKLRTKPFNIRVFLLLLFPFLFLVCSTLGIIFVIVSFISLWLQTFQ